MSTNALPSIEALLKMANLLKPSAIRAAATLRIADHIVAGATDATALAERTGTQPDLMDILVRYLAELGLLRRDGENYSLTGLGLLLRNEEPRFATELDVSSAGRLNCDGGLIVEHYDWSGVRHVVDVGGHTGVILTHLLRAQPHLRGTLVDLKNVAEAAAKRFAEVGLGGRAEAVVGSFFDPLPPGGDVYLLSAILADWTDEQAVSILRRCAEAAGPHGKVLLAEVALVAPTVELELHLRAVMPAPVRAVDELKRLGQAAGLRVTWEGPATPMRSLIEFSSEARD